MMHHAAGGSCTWPDSGASWLPSFPLLLLLNKGSALDKGFCMANAACLSAPPPTVWKPPAESIQHSPDKLTWISEST